MAVPARLQDHHRIYELPPLAPRTKEMPTPKKRSAADTFLLFVAFVFLLVCFWQTLQIRQLADEVGALSEQAHATRSDQARVVSEIEGRLLIAPV